ncbi:MAG: radical SAM protein [Gammaproteobacteria bacterium]|nr:radical SAM protein [Gammaproteobacteria bacterium]
MAAVIDKPVSWWRTPTGEPRGYIKTRRLDELWIHTGTACNLACPFCLEGSKPGDNRLQLVKFADVQPYIDEASALGAAQLSFTGGEPFLAREFHRILEYAAERAPCLVLTNGTRPLQHRMHQLEPLLQARHPVDFRISLDYPDARRHDAGRGQGNFVSALRGMAMLHNMGFNISVARQWHPDEDSDAVAAAFRCVFREHGLPEELSVIWFPDFGLPGEQTETPAITEHCMTAYHTTDTCDDFMCAYSRMVVKQNGRMRVYACTLVDDDPDYDLGDNLADSLDETVMLRHHRCYSCFKYGASCSERH